MLNCDVQCRYICKSSVTPAVAKCYFVNACRRADILNLYLNSIHMHYSDNLFAIDLENELVYLGVEDQLLALDLSTGEVKINIPLQVPNLQFFWNYDYIPREKAIYGVCTGNDHWNWCRVKLDKPLDHNTIKLEFLYHFPVVPLELGPDEGIYYMDKEHQSIWYYTGITLAYGVNYTTGKTNLFWKWKSL